MSSQRRYNPGPLCCEEIEDYDVDGFHPVIIGDTFKDSRYKIVHKLGYGGFSTVWLARDQLVHRYVALKVSSGSGSGYLNEIGVQKYLLDINSRLRISKLLDRFAVRGPNGRHACMAFELHGPNFSSLERSGVKIRPDWARKLARQIANTVRDMHSCNVVVGDFSLGNVLLKLTDIDDWTESDIYAYFGDPSSSCVPVTPLDKDTALPPNVPKYQYESIDFMACDMSAIVPSMVLSDLNEAVYTGPDTQYTQAKKFSAANDEFAAPEWHFKSQGLHSKASDIWALACIFYELRTCDRLFPNSFGTGTDAIQLLLGEVPASYKDFQLTLPEDERVGFLSVEDIKSNCPDSLELELKLKEVGKWRRWHFMTPEQKLQCILDTTSEEDRNDPNMPYNVDKDPYRLPPPAKLSDEELVDLEDLLGKMLRYDPEERPTIEDVLQHPWLNKHYEYLDDMSAPWISSFDYGYDYDGAPEWYDEHVAKKSESTDQEGGVADANEIDDDIFYDAVEEQLMHADLTDGGDDGGRSQTAQEESARQIEDVQSKNDVVANDQTNSDGRSNKEDITSTATEMVMIDEVDNGQSNEGATIPASDRFAVTKLLGLPIPDWSTQQSD